MHTKLKQTSKNISKHEHRYFFYLLLILVGYVSFLVVKPYLVLAALAFITVSFFYPVYKRLLKIFKRTTIATAFSLVIIFISLLLPTLTVGAIAYNQIITFSNDISALTNNGDELSTDPSLGSLNINDLLVEANDLLDVIPGVDYQITEEGIASFIQEVATPAASYIATNVIDIGNSTIRIVTNVIVFFTIVATIFPGIEKFGKFARELSPLNAEFDDLYIRRVSAMSNAMIRGTFVIATLQGVISGLILWIVGVDYVLFFTLLSIFVSIIPLGAGIVNIPLAILLMLTGDIVGGLVIILGNILVVGQIDNILRPKLVPKTAHLHPALTLIGVLGGLQLFGIFGFIFGPIVMIVLTTTIDIYRKYYQL